MTNSMTAFSRASDEQAWGTLVWELRSVNHRYLDITIKIPEEFRSIENEIRSRLSRYIKRGKVDCYLRYKPSIQHQSEIVINQEYSDAVLKACAVISNKLHQPSEINVFEVLRWPGVVEEPESDKQTVTEAALKLFEAAVQELLEARKSEGQRLQAMLEERCQLMKQIVEKLQSTRPQMIESMREKLISRFEELQLNCDKERLEQEILYYLQKMDVDEELDRMLSHFSEIEKIFQRDEPVGRRLDFMMQEFHREANTLGSKSANIETTQSAVELKVLIEQMREQVQNIE